MSNKVGSQGAVFRCPACGSLTTDAYVKQMGSPHKLGAQMMAISLETEDGIKYIAPSEKQMHAANVPIPEDAPPEKYRIIRIGSHHLGSVSKTMRISSHRDSLLC